MSNNYVVSEPVKLPDELLDALEPVTDIPATTLAKPGVAITKYIIMYDTTEISDELLDALENDM